MPSIYLFYIFLLSLFTVLVLIPPISRLAVSIGIFDYQDGRKLHEGNIPRLGGIAIFFAVFLSVILFCDIDRHFRGFLAGGIVIFLTGLTDDLTSLVPRKKLIGQIVAALILSVVGDLSLTNLGNLFGSGIVELGYFSIPFTVFAIVGLTNAINLMDGLDGLAGGVAVIATSAMGVIAFNTGNLQLACLCVALLGALIGFLKFNSYPAKIFMGDAGSLFIGYSLSAIALHLVINGEGQVTKMVPVMIMAVPICDAFYVMGRRLFNQQSVSAPDRTHIHHRFMDMGIGHMGTVVLVYIMCYIFAIHAVFFQSMPNFRQAIDLAVLLVVFYCVTRILKIILKRNTNSFIDEESFINVFSYRWMVRYSHYLLLAIKYLLLLAIIFPIIIVSYPSHNLAAVALLLFFLTSGLLFLTKDWSNRFLLFILYFDSAFLVYVFENYSRDMSIAGVELRIVSTCLFLVLFILSGVLLFARKKSRLLISTPMEYFIIFIVIAIPLLPSSFTGPYHLLTVTGKSLIILLSYKMVFMLNARRNRKIIVATLIALFAVGIQSYM